MFCGAVVVAYECQERQCASRTQSLDQIDCAAVQTSHSQPQSLLLGLPHLSSEHDTRAEEDSDGCSDYHGRALTRLLFRGPLLAET